MFSGYFRIAMDPDSISRTAFAIPGALHEFTRLPFGLGNGLSSFHRLVMNVFSGMIGTQVLCYIDDVLVPGRSADEHLANLDAVFARLRTNNLKLKLSKCTFMRSSVKFLGHIISEHGLQTDPDKVEAVT